MALRWSPEQIACRTKRDKEPFNISLPTICHAIDTRILSPQLKEFICFKWKHNKCKTEDKRGKIPNTTPISERPAGAENRTRPDELKKSFTVDNVKQFTTHQELAESTGMKAYLCEPYSPWQRSTNRNTNGLLWQFSRKVLTFPTFQMMIYKTLSC